MGVSGVGGGLDVVLLYVSLSKVFKYVYEYKVMISMIKGHLFRLKQCLSTFQGLDN